MSLNEAAKFIEKQVYTHNGFRFSKKKESNIIHTYVYPEGQKGAAKRAEIPEDRLVFNSENQKKLADCYVLKKKW